MERCERRCMHRAAMLLSGAEKGVSYGASPGPVPQMCQACHPSARVGSINGQCAGCGLARAKWPEAVHPGRRGPFS